jgi:hypothetical protein
LRIVKKAFIPTALQRRLRKQATDLAGAAATVCLGDGEPPSGATEGNIMRRVLMMALAGTATALATPALADQPAPVDGANCNIVTPTPDAVACSGYWDQNLIAGDALDLTTQHDALAAIGANVPADINDGTRVGPVFDWNTSTFASLPTGTLSSGLLKFGHLMSGIN